MTAPDASPKTRRGVRSIAIRGVVALLAVAAVAAAGLLAQRRVVETMGEPAVVVGLSGWLGTLAAKAGLAARDLAQPADEGLRVEARIRLAVVLDEMIQQRQRLSRRAAIPADVQGMLDSFLAAGRALVDNEAADLADRPAYRTVMDLGPERLPVALDRLAARNEAEGRARAETLMQIQIATGAGILLVLVLTAIAIVPAIRRASAERRSLEEEAARLTVGSAAADASRRDLSQFLLRLEQTLAAAVKTVVGLSDVLALGAAGPLNDKQREYAQRIRADGQRLAQLLEDVHDLALIDAGQLKLDDKTIDLGPFIAQTLDQMRVQADRGRIALMHSLPVDMPRLSADPSRLRQMMRRLIDLAIRTGDNGGQVHVRVAREPAGGLALSVEAGTHGFRPPDAELALSRAEGPGGASVLTLPLVKALAERHGGRLSIGPAPGRGSVATLHFPPVRIIPA
ncbi:MAG: HAMP domain-containing histidine kinase [Alphaproteobacteria bacterium]|nr:HAMP domain-containing histidine kinase [Alphaproteobacteria bacterium]